MNPGNRDPDEINWQPISQMPLIARMIDEALADTRDHLATLSRAEEKPHVLDDATVDRSLRVHSEQLAYAGIYADQIVRWREENPSADQSRELERMEAQNQQLLSVTTTVLALAKKLRGGTIDRIMAMSDLEVGLRVVLGKKPTD